MLLTRQDLVPQLGQYWKFESSASVMLVTTNNLPDRLGRLPWNGSYINLLLARTILPLSISIHLHQHYLARSITNNNDTIFKQYNHSATQPVENETKFLSHQTTLLPTTAFTSRGSFLSSMCFGSSDYDFQRPPRVRVYRDEPPRQHRKKPHRRHTNRPRDDDYDMPGWTRSGSGTRRAHGERRGRQEFRGRSPVRR